jgi:nitroimidazol reductase NimA-like FMN-containing flavoprotein (pyridoxamine 5'-phosphate oxidase superfamily)
VTSRGLDVLTEDECRALLRSHSVGRIAVYIGEAPAILPVNYAMLDDDVVFLTDPGSKLSAALMRVQVAFEVDELIEATHAGWSVLVTGYVEQVEDRETLDRIAALELESWVAEGRDYVVRIRTRTTTGRRLPASEPELTPGRGTGPGCRA